jgi:membrane-associated protein
MLPSAELILETLGSAAVIGVAILIFLETATIFGSVLPGDSLLFLLGLSLGTGVIEFNFALALLMLWIAATLGNQVSYWFGNRVGRDYFMNRSGWVVNAKNVQRTEEFFKRYGIRAILVGRFIPVLRALVPIFAGIGGVEKRLFLKANIFSALVWAVGVTSLGASLGQIEWVRENFELCVLIFVVLSSLPLPIELLRHAIQRKKAKP